MHVFFSPDTNNQHIGLNDEESRHCTRVLRLSEGQQVIVTNGKGSWVRASIIIADHRRVVLQQISREDQFGKRSYHLHMAVAPTKNIDRFEWFLEKSTECGIDEITPIICEQSERRIIKPQRLEKIMAAAMKQSLRAYLPKLNPAIDVQTFLKQQAGGQTYIAHCIATNRTNLANDYKAGSDTVIMVGPEGDFSGTEIEAAISKGFRPISLGAERLRTETAALALCIQVNTMNGLLQ